VGSLEELVVDLLLEAEWCSIGLAATSLGGRVFRYDRPLLGGGFGGGLMWEFPAKWDNSHIWGLLEA